MKPYYQDKWITIYHGDCREILPQLNVKADALITDPPFGIGFTYQEVEKHNNPESYWHWLKPIYESCLTKLNLGAFIAIWQAQLYFKHFWEWFGDGIHIYIGAKNFVQLRKTAIQYGYDPIVVKYKNGASPLRPEKPSRNIDFFVSNTAKWVTQTESIIRQHPCPRPLDQVIQLIENFVILSGLILDPFLGSGTTCFCAKKLNRRCIGIEIEEKYCDIAARRCSQEVMELI